MYLLFPDSDTFTSFANPNYLMTAGDMTPGEMMTDDAINSNISYCDNELYDNPDAMTSAANTGKSRKKYAQLNIASMGMTTPASGDTHDDNVLSPASSDVMTEDSAITSPVDNDLSPAYGGINYSSVDESANSRESGENGRSDTDGSASVMNKQHVQLR